MQTDPVERLRLGAAAMSANVRRYAAQHGLGAGWIAKTIADGGIPVEPPDELAGLNALERRQLAGFDALYERQTGRRWGETAA